MLPNISGIEEGGVYTDLVDFSYSQVSTSQISHIENNTSFTIATLGSDAIDDELNEHSIDYLGDVVLSLTGVGG